MHLIDPATIEPQRHRAVDVPRLRDALLAGWRAGYLLEILDITTAPMYLPVDPGFSPETARPWSTQRWAAFCCEALEQADLFYVTPDMTTLVGQASAAMPPYSLHADRLPARSGFVVFGDTFCSVPATALPPGQRCLLQAALWAPVPDTSAGHGVMLVTLQDTDVLLGTQAGVDHADPAMRATLADMRHRLGPLAYHEEYPLPYGEAPYGEDAPKVRNAAVASLLCTWTLMGQRLTTVDREPMPRGIRRQAAREGRPEPVVRTVTLRQSTRRAREGADDQVQQDGASGRVYKHRWPVTGYGYWRNTWYPSRDRHEPQFVWVPEYMKGPAGAPVIGGERVNVLRR